jgi:predicted nucleic acid-binding protein
MNVVDSSGWLEYYANEPNADFFAPAIENTAELLVPSISLYEVVKRVRIETDEETAVKMATQMQQARIIDLDATIALQAIELSIQHHLPLADSIILATARAFSATLWTQDEHLKDIDGVRFIAKQISTSAQKSS